MDQAALLLQEMRVPYGYNTLKKLRRFQPAYISRMYVETSFGLHRIGGHWVD